MLKKRATSEIAAPFYISVGPISAAPSSWFAHTLQPVSGINTLLHSQACRGHLWHSISLICDQRVGFGLQGFLYVCQVYRES